MSASRARYDVLVETSADAIDFNEDNRIARVNAACVRLFGAARA